MIRVLVILGSLALTLLSAHASQDFCAPIADLIQKGEIKARILVGPSRFEIIDAKVSLFDDEFGPMVRVVADDINKKTRSSLLSAGQGDIRTKSDDELYVDYFHRRNEHACVYRYWDPSGRDQREGVFEFDSSSKILTLHFYNLY